MIVRASGPGSAATRACHLGERIQPWRQSVLGRAPGLEGSLKGVRLARRRARARPAHGRLVSWSGSPCGAGAPTSGRRSPPGCAARERPRGRVRDAVLGCVLEPLLQLVDLARGPPAELGHGAADALGRIVDVRPGLLLRLRPRLVEIVERPLEMIQRGLGLGFAAGLRAGLPSSLRSPCSAPLFGAPILCAPAVPVSRRSCPFPAVLSRARTRGCADAPARALP